MSNYILIILSVGICAFVLQTVLSSFGSYKGICSAIKYIHSLCIFFAIVFPIASIRLELKIPQSQAKDTTNSHSQALPSFETLLEDELEEKINSEIFKQFGIQCKDICIDLSSKESDEQKDITVTSAFITLSKNNEQFCVQVKDFLNKIPELKEAKITIVISENNSDEQHSTRQNN